MSRLIVPIIRKPIQGGLSPRSKSSGRAQHGQGMVEFALVLPLLLLLIFGIMELGRFMIIYTAVHAASREGARYGSAAGLSDSGVPYYLDEPGVRAAAERIAVLVGAEVEPLIWDDGQGNEFEALIGSDVSLGDRIIVSVVASYEPLLGLTPLQPIDIRSTTRRTIVKAVAIGPSGNTGGGPTDSPPVVDIYDPLCPIEIFEPETLDLSAVASDVEDHPEDKTSEIVWYLDGSVFPGCSGGSCSIPDLAPGAHTILAEVTDSVGNTGVDNCNVSVNPAPVVIITAPADGADFVFGFPITFSATASELTPGDLTSQIQWSIDGVLIPETGGSFTRSDLVVGLHTITASVTDGNGQSGSDSVNIVIDPVVPSQLFIVYPADEATFPEGSRINFIGYATDSAGNVVSNSIVWSSSPAGVSGVSANISTNPMGEGIYEVYASAEGLTVSVTIHVTGNDPPSLNITSPIDGYIAQPGETLTFSGTATDDLMGNISNQIDWLSSPAGINTTGATFSIPASTLPVDAYTITASVADPFNPDMVVSVSIMIEIRNLPVVTIVAPVNNANLRWNTPTDFTGIATDYDNVDISEEITWSSSIDGALPGPGATIPATLSAGTHTITATVIDPYTQFSSSASIVVNVWQTICPTSGSTVWGPSRSYLSWNLIIPAQTPLDSVLSSLRLVMNNSPATVSSVTVDGVTVFSSPLGAGSPVDVAPPIWSGTYTSSNYTLPVIFYFVNRPANNVGTFNLQATFEGCSTILQASATP